MPIKDVRILDTPEVTRTMDKPAKWLRLDGRMQRLLDVDEAIVHNPTDKLPLQLAGGELGHRIAVPTR